MLRCLVNTIHSTKEKKIVNLFVIVRRTMSIFVRLLRSTSHFCRLRSKTKNPPNDSRRLKCNFHLNAPCDVLRLLLFRFRFLSRSIYDLYSLLYIWIPCFLSSAFCCVYLCDFVIFSFLVSGEQKILKFTTNQPIIFLMYKKCHTLTHHHHHN